MPPSAPTRKPAPRRRKLALVLLAVAIFFLFLVVFSQQAFDLTFLRPTSAEQTLILAALSALIFLLLVALTFVLLRTLLKLYAERHASALGSKFRTKMVVAALVLSFAPVIFLFIFAYGLMNRSIDKWFSRPVEEVRQDTAAVGSMLSNYASQNARAEAASFVNAPEVQRGYQSGNFGLVLESFRRRETSLQGGFAVALLGSDAEAIFHAPDTWPALRQAMRLNDPKSPPLSFRYQDKLYMIGTAAVGERGSILIAMPLPEDFLRIMSQIEASQQRYLELSRQRKAVRRTYMGLLLLLTVVVLFAATWFALFLSKFVVQPVSALVEATQEISRGRLDYRVPVTGVDELGHLVQSFNRMAAELETSRQQIVASARQAADANVQLEQRRRQMETILESIPTGVLSIDAERRIVHSNSALARILGADSPALAPGAHLREVLPADMVDDLVHLLRKADRMGSTTSQVDIQLPRQTLTAAVTVASLHHAGKRHGYVVVIEDLSDLLKAQKQSAWREVARRVAHEIKNPLTPIALSAERIRRHIDRGAQPDEASLEVIRGCADTIAGAVETVRTLVDEFSTLARFPQAHPQPADVNSIVENALSMFNGRLDGVRLQTFLGADLPRVMADPEALKRAIANLVDNAAEATQNALVREVQISTALVPGREVVEIVIADSGHGVTREVKEKLFLPYFSTKERGTGLGLAIVSRIVEDHHGSIRVEENKPVGARFIVELPVAIAESASLQAVHA